jgi:tetratricopeptide (TPR) repeat protein
MFAAGNPTRCAEKGNLHENCIRFQSNEIRNGTLQRLKYFLTTSLLLFSTFGAGTALWAQDWEMWMRQGYSADSSGRYQDAIQFYDKVIQANPDYAKAWFNRAASKQQLGRQAQALVDLNTCLRLDTGFTDAYFNRALVHLKLGNHVFALTDMELYFRRNSQPDAEDWVFLSHAQEQNQLYKEAAESLNKYLQYDNSDLVQSVRHGRLLSLAGQHQEAEDVFSRLLTRYPEAAVLYEGRGESRLDRGDFREAIDDFNMCLLQGKRTARIYSLRAEARMALNENGDALEDYTQAISRDTASGDLYLDRGLCQLKMNSYAEAELDFDKAIALRCSDLGYCLLARGLARVQSGNGSAACDDWAKAVQLGEKEAGVYLEKYCVRKEPHE